VKSKKIKDIEHIVYDSVQDFKKDNPNAEVSNDWKSAKEGEWVLSDDNRVVQLLKVSHKINHPSDRKNYTYANGWVRTIVGTFLIHKNTFMDTDFDLHPNRYTFSKTIKDTNKRVKQRDNVTKKEKLFATNVAVGMGAVKSYMDAYGELNHSKAKNKAAVLLKQERVMKEVEKSVMDVAKELGVDHEYIFRNLKILAETSTDENIALQSLKELGKAIGTLGGGVKKIEQGVVGLFSGFTPDQIANVERKMISEKKE
jgi:hypothetical protein